jgi:hypothetical protein
VYVREYHASVLSELYMYALCLCVTRMDDVWVLRRSGGGWGTRRADKKKTAQSAIRHYFLSIPPWRLLRLLVKTDLYTSLSSPPPPIRPRLVPQTRIRSIPTLDFNFNFAPRSILFVSKFAP